MDEKLAAEILATMKSGLHAAIKDRLGASYNNPLDKLLGGIVEHHAPALRDLLVGCVAAAAGDPAFADEIRAAVRARLAKVLVERFGGELEKQVNALKSDPATRARITLAIQGIIDGKPA